MKLFLLLNAKDVKNVPILYIVFDEEIKTIKHFPRFDLLLTQNVEEVNDFSFSSIIKSNLTFSHTKENFIEFKSIREAIDSKFILPIVNAESYK
jgi:hypothetical protein